MIKKLSQNDANKEQQIKNSFVYLLPFITNTLLPFITLPIFTRILTKEDYGVLALAQVYAVFCVGLANLGMTIAYERNYFQYRDNPQKTAQLLFSTILFVMINFILFAMLTYVFRETMARLVIGSAVHGNMLFWTFCAHFFYTISYYYLTYFKNSEVAISFVFYAIGSSLINFIISLYLVAFLRIGVIGIIYAQLSSGTIIFSILSYRFIKAFGISVNKEVLFDSLKIAYPLTPRIFLGVISTQFDKYMIGLLASVGGVGIYSIGQKIATLVFSFMTAIENVFSPQVYKRMFGLKDKGGEAIGKYLTPFLYISIFVALLISLFSEEVISILTPPPFHGAINIVIILSMFYGLMFFGKQPQLIFAKKTHIISLLSVSRIGITVGLNIPFIMKWGAIGAAWATLLAGLISGAISFTVAQHYYEIKWEYRKVFAMYGILFAAALAIIILRAEMIDYPIRLAVKCVFALAYIYVGMRIGIITLENLKILRHMVGLRSLVGIKEKLDPV